MKMKVTVKSNKSRFNRAAYVNKLNIFFQAVSFNNPGSLLYQSIVNMVFIHSNPFIIVVKCNATSDYISLIVYNMVYSDISSLKLQNHIHASCVIPFIL